MKNLKKIILSITFLLSTILVVSQSCLPGITTFTTQSEIDNFQIDYPGCTEIEGTLILKGNDITNLNGLSVLTRAHNLHIGEVSLGTNITNLSGLENLTSIGRALKICSNFKLISLEGLNNLEYIGDDVSGDKMHTLDFRGNILLTNFEGLDNLKYIRGYSEISSNISLINFEGLDSLNYIEGTLTVWGNTDLVNFEGLDNFVSVHSLQINNNESLLNLNGFESLTSVNLYINIINNDMLTSLYGIDNITASSIDGLNIYSNSQLSTCHVQSVCDYLVIPGSNVNIYNNLTGCNTENQV